MEEELFQDLLNSVNQAGDMVEKLDYCENNNLEVNNKALQSLTVDEIELYNSLSKKELVAFSNSFIGRARSVEILKEKGLVKSPKDTRFPGFKSFKLTDKGDKIHEAYHVT